MNTKILRNSLGLGGDWEERLQITLIEPPRFIEVDGEDPRPAPRSNLVLSLVPKTSATTKAACDEFLQQTAAAVPGLDVKLQGDKTFADGEIGSIAVVEFDPIQGTRLRQTHLFRIDGEALAQIVVTVDDQTEEKREIDLIEAALKYKPDFLTASDA